MRNLVRVVVIGNGEHKECFSEDGNILFLGLDAGNIGVFRL